MNSHWKMGLPSILETQSEIVFQSIQPLALLTPWWGMKSCRHWVEFKRQIGCYISPSRKWYKSWLLKGSGMAQMTICPCMGSASGNYGILLDLGEPRKLCWDALPLFLSWVATSLLIRFTSLANWIRSLIKPCNKRAGHGPFLSVCNLAAACSAQ